MFYEKYTGQTSGRLLYAVEVYGGLHLADKTTVAAGHIVINEKKIAYQWEWGGDTPIFNWKNKQLNRNQRMFNPYLNSHEKLRHVELAIERAKKVLTFEDYFHMKYCMEKPRLQIDMVQKFLNNKMDKQNYFYWWDTNDCEHICGFLMLDIMDDWENDCREVFGE